MDGIHVFYEGPILTRKGPVYFSVNNVAFDVRRFTPVCTTEFRIYPSDPGGWQALGCPCHDTWPQPLPDFFIKKIEIRNS